MEIFTSDPEYQATPLVSSIPPPCLTEEEVKRLKSKHASRRFHDASSSNAREHRNGQFLEKKKNDELAAEERWAKKRRCITHTSSDYSSNEKKDVEQQDPAPTQPSIPSPDPLEWYIPEESAELTIPKKENEEDKVKASEQEKEVCCFDSNLANEILEAKKALGGYSRSALHQARHASNPYESLETNIFLNRAALKLAEIDSHVHFASIFDQNPRFADLCCGPGGFTEYLLWRYPQTKGCGITLATGDHLAFSPNLFLKTTQVKDRFQLVKGDLVLEKEKFVSLVEDVMLVVADGGIAVEGVEDQQEARHVDLIKAEIQTAFQILSPKGCFVLKLYDATSATMTQLLSQLCHAFEKCALHKPLTSRPANSERYFIGINYHPAPPPSSLSSSFLDYLTRTNQRHQRRQLLSLSSFLHHLKSPHMPSQSLSPNLLRDFLRQLDIPEDPPKRSRKTV